MLDASYLPRWLVMFSSLVRVCPQFRMHVYCVDETAERVLAKLGLAQVEVVPIRELEEFDPELATTRDGRSPKEYCLTARSSALLHTFARNPRIGILTLLDSDLHFYADPGVLLDELGSENSILLVPHRYSPGWEHWAEETGEPNGGFVTFRNDQPAVDALQWWRERCIEWCYDRVEPGRFTDQRYLHDWPQTRPGVRVLENPGGGLGPWNMRRYRVERHGDQFLVDGHPLVFVHFQSLQLYRGLAMLRRYGLGTSVFSFTPGQHPAVWTTDPGWEISADDKELLWHPYVKKVMDAAAEIEAVEPGFDARARTPSELLARVAARPVVPRAIRKRLYEGYLGVRRAQAGAGRRVTRRRAGQRAGPRGG
jgi:hypothetical protein